MIPIGRGQRELIIGDRQTGNTTVGLTLVDRCGTPLCWEYLLTRGLRSWGYLPNRDANLTPGAANNSLRARFVTTLLQYRSAIISHLSAITLFLGFHTLGLYVHNDVMQAFGTPFFLGFHRQLCQVAHGQNVGSPLSCGDVLVHHAIALGDLRVAGFMIRRNLLLVLAKCIWGSKRHTFIAVMDDRRTGLCSLKLRLEVCDRSQ
jgi:hypothetical protein